VHDINSLNERLDFFKANLGRRNFDIGILDHCASLNSKRKDFTLQVDNLRAEANQLSKKIGDLKKNKQDASEFVTRVGEIKSQIQVREEQLEKILIEINDNISTIPNIISDEVPVGSSDQDNKQVFAYGEPKKFDFQVKDHVAIGEDLGLLEFDSAAKITGSRFVVYKGDLARLERALISFMIDEHVSCGYQEILPPLIVNQNSLFGTGQLPKFKQDLFRLDLPDRDWYLIPTAEVPVTNLKREQLFDLKELPLRYVSYTPCFRSEAGSYGKDTRGLIRLHQFNKVELVNIVAEEDSEKYHQEMIERACSILKKLSLPYRGMLLCSGDIGFSARKCIDLEVWLPSQNTYREISSISNCWDFQSRRAQIRYRNAQGKPAFAHTLNGSGLAVGRTLVAILENFQQRDGSVNIPEVLWPYMQGKKTLRLN